MKNIVLCFDQTRDHPGYREISNVEALYRMLDDRGGQLSWYHEGRQSRPTLRWRDAAMTDARLCVRRAYEFLIDRWEPGDQVYIFGGGRGGYCGQALARLLGTVGVLPDLLDHVLSAYALPRTPRSERDWHTVQQLAASLAGGREIAVPVTYLGMWDVLRVPGATRHAETEPAANVARGRHAQAIDGGLLGEHLSALPVEQVWFRGGHRDVAGGPGACRPLAEIAMDWVLDGALKAGLTVRPAYRYTAPAPGEFDALAGGSRTVSLRRLPPSALVHASVQVYLREHPGYWRRLPAHVIWADVDWAARSERLVPAAVPTPAPAVVRVPTAVAVAS